MSATRQAAKGKADRAAMRIEPVWQQMTPELKAEVLAFWKDNKAIGDEAKAAQRVDQVACIGRDQDGRICAVSTAVLRVLPRLRQPMYYYRHFIAEAQRGQRMTKPFMLQSKQAMHDYNASLPEPESLGILIELESKLLSGSYTRAYEADADCTFIGYSPRGFQLYVSYFKDAKLQPPAPLRRRGRPAARSN